MKSEKVLHEALYRGYRIVEVEITDDELSEDAWCVQYRVFPAGASGEGDSEEALGTFDSLAEAKGRIDSEAEKDE